MDGLLLHSDTKRQLNRFVSSPSHALILLAPDGSGKRTVTEALVRILIKTDPGRNLVEQTNVLYIQPKNQVISIDDIRSLRQGLHLKTIGKSQLRRAVLIEAAHAMTHEAQNALLKMLEEPPADTVFVLTAESAQSLLPTIYSRTQHIQLKTPRAEEIFNYFRAKGFESDKVTVALRYSGNRLGLAQALLDEDEAHPLFSAVIKARAALSSSLFERLQSIDEWVSHKDELPKRLDALIKICQAGIARAAEKDDSQLMKRWQGYYQAIYDTAASLSYTPNSKLLLTHMFMQLR